MVWNGGSVFRPIYEWFAYQLCRMVNFCRMAAGGKGMTFATMELDTGYTRW